MVWRPSCHELAGEPAPSSDLNARAGFDVGASHGREAANRHLNWILNRRSVRRYRDCAVPKSTLDRVLEAARWAPSAHNRQPWRFLVIERAEEKARLADAMGRRLFADRKASGDRMEDVQADVLRSRMRVTQAPALILVCMTLEDMDRYPDERRAQAERVMAIQSTAMSVQNILLAAHTEGLGACWMCAPLFCGETVIDVLALPACWEPQTLITLGFPENIARPRSRLPLAEISTNGAPSA